MSRKPLETRGQFVSGYVARSGLAGARRVRGGFVEHGWVFTASRCACGEPDCTGWKMDAVRQEVHA